MTLLSAMALSQCHVQAAYATLPTRDYSSICSNCFFICQNTSRAYTAERSPLFDWFLIHSESLNKLFLIIFILIKQLFSLPLSFFASQVTRTHSPTAHLTRQQQ